MKEKLADFKLNKTRSRDGLKKKEQRPWMNQCSHHYKTGSLLVVIVTHRYQV